jgi:uncharacterized protein YbjT (DUF2867 family)
MTPFKEKYMGKTVVITGSTGMIGKGVLLECLDSPNIDHIIAINRSPLSLKHPKLTEICHQNFHDFSSIKGQLSKVDACFHIMGVSAFGRSEDAYHALTYDVTKALATTLLEFRANITFTYVTGSGTDSSELGHMMWARVKGKTENMLFRQGFKDVYAFRPGAIIPERGVTAKATWIRIVLMLLRPLFPIMRFFPMITSTSAIGKAMIAVTMVPVTPKILHGADINQLSTINQAL